MNSRLTFWIVLAALNGAVWLYVARGRAPASVPAADARLGQDKQAFRAPPKAAPVVVRTNSFEWGQLESEDYRTYIGRLRSIGCPEETIRDIVISDLEKLMAPEVRSLEGQQQPPKYWEPKPPARTLDNLEKLGKKQEIDFRKREIVRELLGIDLASERARTKGESDLYEERLGFLPPEKLMRVRMAVEKANREETLLRETSWLDHDQLTAGERQKLRQIQKAREEEVAQVLSPPELDQYQLWFSPSAYRTRDAFLVLEPNEQDFLALYEAQREFDLKWDGVEISTLSPSEAVELEQARQRYEERVREHLGPERYEKFLQTREPDFQQLQETVTQFGLSPAVVGEIYGFKQVLLEERSRVAQSQSLDAAQKAEILHALSDETQRAAAEVMGPRAWRYFVRTGAGRWIWE